jgi:hypothetical protein
VRLFKRSTTSDQEGEVLLRDLITEIDQLNAEQRAGAARGLAMLWEAFGGRFGGIDGFLEADAAQRGSYIAELRSAAAKMNLSDALARSHYALSPRLMAAYLDALSGRLRTTTALELARAVVTLIDQGSKLRAPSEWPSNPALGSPDRTCKAVSSISGASRMISPGNRARRLP